jgi:hypothetical protein
MRGGFGVAWRAELCDAERTCGVFTKAHGARPSIRLGKSSETVRDRADALGASRTGVDTRDACATRFICARAEISIRGNNEHLLAVAARR